MTGFLIVAALLALWSIRFAYVAGHANGWSEGFDDGVILGREFVKHADALKQAFGSGAGDPHRTLGRGL